METIAKNCLYIDYALRGRRGNSAVELQAGRKHVNAEESDSTVDVFDIGQSGRLDTAIADPNGPLGSSSDLRVVRNDYEGQPALAVQAVKQIEHDRSGGSVQVSGRLIGEKQFWIVR